MPFVTETNSLSEALEIVLEIIEDAVSNKQSPAKVAIIGRKKSQIIPYQIFLASKNVSFCAAEDLQVFMSKAFDRLLELIAIKSRADRTQMRTQVIDDTIKLCDLVKRYPIAKAEKDQVRRHFTETKPKTVLEAASAIATYVGVLKGSNQNGKMSDEMSVALTKYLTARNVTDTLLAMASDFEGLQIDLGKAEDDIFYADPPFLQLAEYAERYGDDYGKFLEDIQLAKEQLVHVPPFEDDDAPMSTDELWKRPIQLMTALRAKGKEFDTVVLLDVNDGIWPNKNAKTIEQKESERRVFYVAFTRAMKRVVMLVTKKFGSKAGIVSPYVQELYGDAAADDIPELTPEIMAKMFANMVANGDEELARALRS